MKLENIKQQLTELVEMTDKWLNQGYMPSIEKHISLARLSEIYDALNDNLASPRLVQTNQLPPAQPIQQEQPEITVHNNPEPVFNEQPAQPAPQPQQPQAQQPQPQPANEPMVTLLGQQITIQLRNDFISELFWKDENFFNNEMCKFNDMKSQDQAIIYVTEKYNWAGNNQFAQKFIELISNLFNK